MSVDFRGNPLFPEGFNNPTRFEADVYDCEVWGNIPSDIEGTFFRMQCDYEYPPPHNDWMTGFNGDGHISSLVFKNGHVDFKARYVKTDRIMAERKARKRLFGVYRNPFTDDPSVKNVNRGTANTHMYWHGGKLLVLKEDSLPYIVDPHTLETKGVWDFHGKWKSQTMSAHPKIDPVSGEMIAYGYQAKGLLTDDVAYYIIGKDGRVKKEVWFKAPYIGIMHDQAITQKHIALPLIAMTSSMDRLKAGNPMWTWDGSLPTMVAIMPRDGDAKDVRWFKGPSRMTLHFLNATTVGNKVVMELPCNDSHALAVPDQALDLRSGFQGRPDSGRSGVDRQWFPGAYGRPVSLPAVQILLRAEPRSQQAGRRKAGRPGHSARHEHLSASGCAYRQGGGVLCRRRAEPAGTLLRAAQGRYGRGRRLHHGRRQQLREHVIRSRHR